MRVLTFTNLYPGALQPRHGVFIEHRLKQLLATGRVSIRVVAPSPWVPGMMSRWAGHRAVLARLPAYESYRGVEVWRPRFFAIPRLSGWLNPLSMALAAWPTVRRLQRKEDFDIIDAHFVYPDGAAAVLLAGWLGKPVTVTARGTDINEFPDYRVPGAWIRWVLRRADALVGVSQALCDRMLALGATADRLSTLRNGVDLELFSPQLNQPLDFDNPTWLSVGHLIPQKGHDSAIAALKQLPGARLIIIGDGPDKPRLQQLAAQLGVDKRLQWTGTLRQTELARYYARADVTVLASQREGMPNVLLESLASGTPVIASDVGGCAEIVTSPKAGMLMREDGAAGVVEAFERLVASRPDRHSVRIHAEGFGWAPTVRGLAELFDEVIRRHHPSPPTVAGS